MRCGKFCVAAKGDFCFQSILRKLKEVHLNMGFRMNQPTQKLLKFLLDNKWHFEPPKEVSVNTVNGCHRKGFLRLKRVILKRKGPLETYRIAMRITVKGKRELKNLTS